MNGPLHRQMSYVGILFLLLFTTSCSQRESNPWIDRALGVANAMFSNDTTGYLPYIRPGFRNNFTPSKVRNQIKMIEDRFGTLDSLILPVYKKVTSSNIVDLLCCLKKGMVTWRFVFDDSIRLIGTTFLRPIIPYDSPSYVDTSAFIELPALLGAEPNLLPGKFTVPRGRPPYPAVIFIHDGGPWSEDETRGLNLLFKDLAWGLASRGIAGMRYQKRTYAYPGQLSPDSVTLENETIDDVYGTIEWMKTRMNLDSTRIFLIGHGIGGYLIPRLLSEKPLFAGGIIMGSPAKSVVKGLRERVQYLLSLPDSLLGYSRVSETILSRLDSFTTGMLPDTSRVFGMPASYFYELKKSSPDAYVRSVTAPLLIMHGGRDFEYGRNQIREWKALFSDTTAVVFKSYPELNHLFENVQSSSSPSPRDYFIRTHVDSTVIFDIADWIWKNSRP